MDLNYILELAKDNASHIQIINGELGELTKDLGNLAKDMSKIATDVEWLKKFFFIIVGLAGADFIATTTLHLRTYLNNRKNNKS